MKMIRIFFIIIIFTGLPRFAQTPSKEAAESKDTKAITNNDADKKRISEIETNLKKNEKKKRE